MKTNNKNKNSLPLSRFRVRRLSGVLRLVAGCLLGFFALVNFALINASLVSAQTVNPLEGNARAAFAGAALFRAQCATCHGADAKGISSIDAPDLTLMWSQRQLSAQDVFDTIRNGIQGSIMPPHDFTDTEIDFFYKEIRKNIPVSLKIPCFRGRGKIAQMFKYLYTMCRYHHNGWSIAQEHLGNLE